MARKAFFRKIKVTAYILLPVVLLALPSTFFDNGRSLCVSQLLLHTECPGCGITRSIMHFIHFEFAEAWAFNKLVIVVLPLLVFVWATDLMRDIRWLRRNVAAQR